MRWRSLSSIAGVLAVLAIVVGVNMVADARLAGVRLDLTQQRLYTLSPGTRAILAGLKQPVTLRLFYSRALGANLPAYGSYADHIRELLEDYAQAAGGKLRLEFFDPQPFSDTEDRAMAYGLQGVPLDQSGQQVYFGIVGTNLLDDERTIAFLQPDRERFLEYDLSRLVYELSSPARPVVGVMSSLPLDGDPRMMMMRGQAGGQGQPYAVMTLLRQTNQTRLVPTHATAIDPDIRVLLVAQAQHLSDATQYAIDQFVMRGGALMAMVDPYNEAQAATPDASGMPPADTASDLKRLFDAWGIGFDPTQVVGDPDGAWRVRAPGNRNQAVDYLAWFNIHDGVSRNDPATADLQQVTVASAGALTRKPGASIDFTPLLSSSDRSGLIPLDKVKMPDPAALLADFQPAGGPRVIAARVRGMLTSAFPDAPAGHLAATAAPANIVVVADADILDDRFWVRQGDFFGRQDVTPFSDNGAFVANLVGTLAGGDALLGLRARGAALRPFDLVMRMQADAEGRYRKAAQTLQQHLGDLEKQLQQLRQGQAGKDQAIIAPAQRAAIDAARREMAQTRGQLRAVQFDLNRDIARLQTELLIFNVLLVPLLVAFGAIGLALYRRRQRRTAPAAAPSGSAARA